MRYRQLGDNESPEELHRMALGADSYFAGQVAQSRGIPAETLHYLIRKEVFPVPVMARRDQNDTERALSNAEQKNLWKNAARNPALSTEDLVWIYEQISGSKYDPKAETSSSWNFAYANNEILRAIGVHRNTPSELVEIIRGIRINGNPVLRQYDFDVRDEQEYENYFIDWRSGRPVAPNPPPKPKSIPGALPSADYRKP